MREEAGSNLSEAERLEADLTTVGDGTRDTAPDYQWPEPGVAAYRKAIGAVASFALGQLAVAAGLELPAEVEQAIVGLAVAFVVWRLPNER